MDSKDKFKNTFIVKRDYLSFKIYINELLHLEIRMNNHDGVQAWYEGSGINKMYYIEFYRQIGEPITLEYDYVENWKAILKLIDENI